MENNVLSHLQLLWDDLTSCLKNGGFRNILDVVKVKNALDIVLENIDKMEKKTYTKINLSPPMQLLWDAINLCVKNGGFANASEIIKVKTSFDFVVDYINKYETAM